jgi:hypothetical protein
VSEYDASNAAEQTAGRVRCVIACPQAFAWRGLMDAERQRLSSPSILQGVGAIFIQEVPKHAL